MIFPGAQTLDLWEMEGNEQHGKCTRICFTFAFSTFVRNLRT
jgi:hypothetical protein